MSKIAEKKSRKITFSVFVKKNRRNIKVHVVADKNDKNIVVALVARRKTLKVEKAGMWDQAGQDG